MTPKNKEGAYGKGANSETVKRINPTIRRVASPLKGCIPQEVR